MGEDKSQIQAN